MPSMKAASNAVQRSVSENDITRFRASDCRHPCNIRLRHSSFLAPICTPTGAAAPRGTDDLFWPFHLSIMSFLPREEDITGVDSNTDQPQCI
jgi:hypothetical protein